MCALLSKVAGGPETLQMTELPDPKPAQGQVVIAVKACAINYPDVLLIEDRYQGSRRALSPLAAKSRALWRASARE